VRCNLALRTTSSVRTVALPKMQACRFSTQSKEVESDEVMFDFLDPNNPPELTDEQVSRLSDEGWGRVKPVYPKDFKTMVDKLSIKGVPDYSQLDDLSKAFSPDEPVPYYVESDDSQSNKSELNKCILCGHYQRKMCSHLDRLEYTNVALLNKFVNERSMINSRRVNGTCKNSQVKLAKLIRRARQVGLISYLEKWEPPVSFMKKMKWFKEDAKVEEREFKSKHKKV
jgi:small subunit ribosomal protein S18